MDAGRDRKALLAVAGELMELMERMAAERTDVRLLVIDDIHLAEGSRDAVLFLERVPG